MGMGEPAAPGRGVLEGGELFVQPATKPSRTAKIRSVLVRGRGMRMRIIVPVAKD